jgi:hypothetical protein
MIYKYKKLIESENTIKLIMLGELYFTSPDKLNDPFDSRISFDFFSLSDTEVKIHLTHLYQRLISLGKNPELSVDYLNFLFTNRAELQKINDDSNFVVTNEKIGVFSSSKEWDNLLLWSHYGDHHKGIVVGLNEEKIINDYKFLICGDVNYPHDNNPPTLLPSMSTEQSMHTRFFYKAKDWAYENEFRFVNDLQPDLFERKIFCPLSIEEITFGFRVNVAGYEDLIEHCKSKGIKVYQTTKDRTKFSVSRVGI